MTLLLLIILFLMLMLWNNVLGFTSGGCSHDWDFQNMISLFSLVLPRLFKSDDHTVHNYYFSVSWVPFAYFKTFILPLILSTFKTCGWYHCRYWKTMLLLLWCLYTFFHGCLFSFKSFHYLSLMSYIQTYGCIHWCCWKISTSFLSDWWPVSPFMWCMFSC